MKRYPLPGAYNPSLGSVRKKKVLSIEGGASTPRGASKTGPFKRRCSSAESIVVNSLVRKVALDTDVARPPPSSPIVEVRPPPRSPIVDKQFPSAPPAPSSCAGLPTCFAAYMRKTGGSRASSIESARSSVASTVMYPDEDSGGSCAPEVFFAQTPPVKPPKAGQRASVEANFEASSAVSLGLGQRATPPKTKAPGKATQVANLDVMLGRPRMSVSKGPDVRVELCCMGPSGGRIFVFGSTVSRYGAALVEHSQLLVQHIAAAEGGITKDGALRYLRSLKQ